jgi:hypothetical protein
MPSDPATVNAKIYDGPTKQEVAFCAAVLSRHPRAHGDHQHGDDAHRRQSAKAGQARGEEFKKGHSFKFYNFSFYNFSAKFWQPSKNTLGSCR